MKAGRWLLVAAYCASFVGLGLCIAALGPALLPLATQSGTTVAGMAPVFVARSAGYLSGSLSGPLFDMPWWDGDGLIAASLVLAGIGAALLPVATAVGSQAVLAAMQGVGMGFLDTGANVMTLQHFRNEGGEPDPASGMALQALHASFAIGAILAPLLVGGGGDRWQWGLLGIGLYCAALGVGMAVWRAHACLRFRAAATARAIEGPASGTDVASPTASVSGVAAAPAVEAQAAGPRAASAGTGAAPGDETSPAPAPATAAPASTAGGAVAPGGDFTLPHGGELASAQTAEARTHGATPLPEETAPGALCCGRMGAGAALVLSTAALLGLYVGCEASYGGLLVAYCVQAVGLSEPTAADITAAYWGAIAVGRVGGVFMARGLSARFMITCAVALSCLAASGLVVTDTLGLGNTASGGGGAGGAVEVALWVLVPCLGLGFSIIFPSAIALAESFGPLAGWQATAMVIGAAIGEASVPPVVAALFGPTDTAAAAASRSVSGSSLPIAVVACCAGIVLFLWAEISAGTRVAGRRSKTKGLPAATSEAPGRDDDEEGVVTPGAGLSAGEVELAHAQGGSAAGGTASVAGDAAGQGAPAPGPAAEPSITGASV